MKKTISIVLSIMMIMCFMPSMAFADDVLDLSTGAFIEPIDPLNYTGQKINVNPKVFLNGHKDPMENTNYTISYSPENVTMPGEYTVTATGTGSAINSCVETFKVIKNLSDEFNVPTSKSGIIYFPATVAAITAQSFTGSEIKPDLVVTVFNCDIPLIEGTDYNVTYASNTSPGSASYNVNFIGDYAGTINGTFEIGKMDLTDVDNLNIGYGDTYTTKTALTEDDIREMLELYLYSDQDNEYRYDMTKDDYDIDMSSLPSPLKCGSSYLITITGKGKYFTGSFKLSIDVGKDILDFKITTTPSALNPGFVFDGKEKKFSNICVSSGASILRPSLDYVIEYSDNKNQGTSTLIIHGKGDYVGFIMQEFSIEPLQITNGAITFEDLGTVVAGSHPQPRVYLKSNGHQLTVGEDFNYSYLEDTTKKTITVTVTGNWNLYGTASRTYSTGQDISYASTVFSPSSKIYEYTGTYVIPSLAVYNGTTRLTENTHYTLTCTNNVNVGIASVKITGKGTYSGTKTETYTISKRTIKSSDITVGTKTYTYDGTAKKPTISVYSGGRTLTLNTDYDVTYSNNVNPGTATVTVKGKGNYEGTATATFTISGTDINTCTATLSQTNYNYTGYACSPTVTVKKGSVTLVKDRDYTVTYSNNIYAGTATCIVTGKGSYSGTIKLSFTITGKANSIYTSFSKYTRYLTSDPFLLSPSSTGDETGFSFSSSDKSVATVSTAGLVNIVGTGIAKITITTVGTKIYNSATKTITITVKPSKVTPKLYSTSKGKLKVRVTKATGVTKYQIRYGRAGSYKSYYMSYANNSFTTQSMTFSKLKSGYKYYVKVRPYKLASDGTKVYGNWSSTKSIRIK